jgi:molybdopterin-guanine dinucleotide biosynthesis protein B
MKRIHILGRKNSGKTTLIVDLVKEFTRRGYRVGTIKHTHHQHELDSPGKDSHSHREAGSAAVGILTRNMNAIFWPQPDNESKANKYDQFDAMMGDCDLVLVEGDSQADAIKIEVFRLANANGDSPIAESDSDIKAIVTDDVLDSATATWARSDLNLVADNIGSLLNLERHTN